MTDIYLVSPDSHTAPMQRVRCKDEVKELQHLLHHNPNLLPGAQIDPDDPRRWLLVRREMPVPDAALGLDRWSIDFLYVDQSARPTFVECKRYRDTRARREVVGQMLEYAANGPRYWTADALRGFAAEAAAERGQTLEQALQALRPDEDEAPEPFFERVLANLREGVLRLIFFMEEAPVELAGIVEFLNSQMERSEVLVVEVRQFTDGRVKIAVPMLIGYTEQARQVKQVVTVTPKKKRRQWDEATYFEDIAKRLTPARVEQVRSVYNYAGQSPYAVRFGTGPDRGSFGLYLPVCPRSLMSIYSDGKLALNFGWYNGSAEAEAVRDAFKQRVAARLGLGVGEYEAHELPEFYLEDWADKAEGLIAVLGETARDADSGG